MPVTTANITTAIGDSVEIVVGSLSNTVDKILTTGGWLLVFILASLAFMFIFWAIRLFHLRGR